MRLGPHHHSSSAPCQALLNYCPGQLPIYRLSMRPPFATSGMPSTLSAKGFRNRPENVRVRGRRVVQRHVLYLGEINDSQRAAWCRSIEVVEGKSRSRQMALFPGDRDAPALSLWGRLELDRFWSERLPPSRQGTRLTTAHSSLSSADPVTWLTMHVSLHQFRAETIRWFCDTVLRRKLAPEGARRLHRLVGGRAGCEPIEGGQQPSLSTPARRGGSRSGLAVTQSSTAAVTALNRAEIRELPDPQQFDRPRLRRPWPPVHHFRRARRSPFSSRQPRRAVARLGRRLRVIRR